MKKLVLIPIYLFLAIPFLQAQVQVPQASPHAAISQTVGLTNVEIDYSRPGVKERKIFGELIPYSKLWRTGANKNTTITFSDNVKINGKTLESGTYAIFTKPGKDSWQIYFYSDFSNWGLPQNWEEKKIALEAEAKVQKTALPWENFTILINNLTNNSATLNFIWENTMASLKFEVPTDEKAMKSIEAALKGEPQWTDYFAAADYYFSEGKDMEQALRWMTTAVEMNNEAPFYVLRKKALIEYELGERDAAVNTMKQSLEGARKANNDDYVKMNETSLKEWKAN